MVTDPTQPLESSWWQRVWFALTGQEPRHIRECEEEIARTRRETRAEVTAAKLSQERAGRELERLRRYRTRTETLVGVMPAPKTSNGNGNDNGAGQGADPEAQSEHDAPRG